MKSILIVFLFAVLFAGRAQDSSMVLPYEVYMDQVMKNHPIAFRADIVASSAELGVKQSRGAFDPKLFGDYDAKGFENENYYRVLKSGLKVPTWFGITAEAGYSYADGTYLNPQNRIPDAGLWYAGLRLELGNGLIIDERRGELAKAKLALSSSEFERNLIINELRMNSSLAYWSWMKSFQTSQVYRQALENSTIRFEAVKGAAELGDRPFIDTVEAYATVKMRTRSYIQARNDFENAQLKLQLYLWSDGFVPLEINGLIPEIDLVQPTFAELSMDSLISNHPYVKINEFRMQTQQIDLRMKREALKPNLSLNYNLLTESAGGSISPLSAENYTWGAALSYPILTRKERSGVKLAELKIDDQEMKNVMVLAEIKYKINAAMNTLLMTEQQVSMTQEMMQSIEQLYDAERELFTMGESSVFMINARENSWLQSRIEFISSQYEFNARWAELQFELQLN